MLPLPPFELHAPASLEDAITLLSRYGSDATLMAGGTDLLPNMKQGLTSPRHLVTLANVAALRGISQDGSTIRIGAMTPLDVLANDASLLGCAPALREAAGAVGGPHHRRMGTLGGNLCLDTRCRYYNQTHFWRQALGYCLKKDGTVCHVVAGGQRCVAAASNDTATAAIALEMTLSIAGPAGTRSVAARDFYTADGLKNTLLGPSEIVTDVALPMVAGRRSAYEKLRRRGAIDFPLLSVAARLDTRGEEVTGIEIVVSALGARPRRIATAATLAAGKNVRELPCQELAEAARKECHPLSNVDRDTEWRREMVPVLVKRALTRIAPEAGAAHAMRAKSLP